MTFNQHRTTEQENLENTNLNPIVKHTLDCLPKIYGKKMRKKKYYEPHNSLKKMLFVDQDLLDNIQDKCLNSGARIFSKHQRSSDNYPRKQEGRLKATKSIDLVALSTMLEDQKDQKRVGPLYKGNSTKGRQRFLTQGKLWSEDLFKEDKNNQEVQTKKIKKSNQNYKPQAKDSVKDRDQVQKNKSQLGLKKQRLKVQSQFIQKQDSNKRRCVSEFALLKQKANNISQKRFLDKKQFPDLKTKKLPVISTFMKKNDQATSAKNDLCNKKRECKKEDQRVRKVKDSPEIKQMRDIAIQLDSLTRKQHSVNEFKDKRTYVYLENEPKQRSNPVKSGAQMRVTYKIDPENVSNKMIDSSELERSNQTEKDVSIDLVTVNKQSNRRFQRQQGDSTMSIKQIEKYLKDKEIHHFKTSGHQYDENIDNESQEQKYLATNMNSPELITFSHQEQQNQEKQPSEPIDKKFQYVNKNGLFAIPQEQEYASYIKHYEPLSDSFDFKKLIKSKKFAVKKNSSQKSLYMGEVNLKKEKHGLGLDLTPEMLYQGTYKNGFKTFGYQKNIDGVYVGQFQVGDGNSCHRSGKGKFFWHNGESFSGTWKNGVKEGIGVWKSPKGDRYEGYWLMNRQHGKGKFTSKNSVYEGQFVSSIKQGHGTELFRSGDRYIGEFQDGKSHGRGKYIWRNGSYYEGQFRHGLREGWGKWFESFDSSYEGYFQNDFKHGKGAQIRSGIKVQGLFDKGKMIEVFK